jgi:hypothetical protein
MKGNDLQNTKQKARNSATTNKNQRELTCSGKLADRAQPVPPIVLVLKDTNIIWYGNHVGEGGVVFVHVVKLHVFTFLVSFGDVRYDFHVKTMSLLPYVL